MDASQIATPGSPTEMLIRRLDSVSRLTDEEKAALAALPAQVTELPADRDIVREGDRPTRCCVILEGFAFTSKLTARGRRQIMAFFIPGDMADLQSLHLAVMDASLTTMTPCKVAFIQHEALHRLCSRHPGITASLWRETLIHAAIFREWVMNVGQREALARIAHVCCEMFLRMQKVGLVEGDTCSFPVTQGELGDAVGVTAVHVNRTLQEMRARGLIELDGHHLRVPNWKKLVEIGEFDPTYLHLSSQQAAA